MALKPPDPENTPVSLDDLLRANRDQFERMFARQEQSLDALRVDQRPPPRQQDVPSSGSGPAVARPIPPPVSSTAAAKPPAPMLPLQLQQSPADSVIPASASVRTQYQQKLNPLTLNLIGQALSNICREMTTVLQCSAASATMRTHAAAAALISDSAGRMLAGNSSSYIADLLAQQSFDLQPGDVLLHSDPYLSDGAVARTGDWLVMLPVFFDTRLIGFSVMAGPVMDTGAATPGSATATSIFGEGMRIPPVKIYQHGELNQALLEVILNNTRTPQYNRHDLLALIAGCRSGEQRLLELCRRFGTTFYLQAANALLERSRRLLAGVIREQLPQEPQAFEDYIDDDGCGCGPFKLKLSMWREEEHAYFDWTGTAAQAAGPVNCYLHEGLFKRFIVHYLASLGKPVAINDGAYPLIHVNIPQGSLLRPQFPAALAHGDTTLARQFDVLNGVFGKTIAALATAGGVGSGAYFHYRGVDNNGHDFQFTDVVAEGMPGRPAGDGIDAQGCAAGIAAAAVETVENDYPLVIEQYRALMDSGGAGRHRGGHGVEKIYLLLAAGEIALYGERQHTPAWGIAGGKAGSCSQTWLIRQDGSRETLPAKTDHVKVQSGDRIVLHSAGGGGWGDPLQRDAQRVAEDVARALLTAAAAQDVYGVVLNSGATITIDQRATRELRARRQREKEGKPLPRHDFGGRPG